MTLNQNSEDLFLNIGIDSIGFHAPRFYLNLENLALKRGIDPDKYKYGLMASEIRIPDMGEDIISLGTKAAFNALIRGKISAKDIDAVFVGTETTVYAVKSVSNIIKDLLGIKQNCITQDVSNACAGGTLALLNAVSMIESGIIERALIVTVDIASYRLGSSGEPTQGAGAAAMILSRNPRIAKISVDFGRASGNVNDFFRPAGEKHARVFGHYSVDSYIKFQLAAYDNLLSRIGEFYADYYVFHAPYAKLPLKFMRKLIKERWLDKLDYLQHIKDKKISTLFKPKNFDYANQKFLISKELSQALDRLDLHEDQRKIYDLWISHEIQNTLLPALKVPNYFGNMYTASIWAELAYVIENYGKPNESIYFGSYGSGATAISGILKIQPEAPVVLENSLKMESYFYDKTQINVAQYERVKFDNDDFSNKKSNEWAKSFCWGKVQPLLNGGELGTRLNYCDEGCILPSNSNMNSCPKGHLGNHEIFFPMIGVLKKKKDFNQHSLDPLFRGYFLVSKEAKRGDLMEMDLRRTVEGLFERNLKPRKENLLNQVKGLIQWMPVYHARKNSQYESLIQNDATQTSVFKSANEMEDFRF